MQFKHKYLLQQQLGLLRAVDAAIASFFRHSFASESEKWASEMHPKTYFGDQVLGFGVGPFLQRSKGKQFGAATSFTWIGCPVHRHDEIQHTLLLLYGYVHLLTAGGARLPRR